jgi:hypothetical protein
MPHIPFSCGMYEHFLDVEVTFSFPRPISSTRFDPSPVTISFQDGRDLYTGKVKHLEIYPLHHYDGIDVHEGARVVVARARVVVARGSFAIADEMFEFVGESRISGILNEWEERVHVECMSLDELRAHFSEIYR